jgi:hypothetical protein
MLHYGSCSGYVLLSDLNVIGFDLFGHYETVNEDSVSGLPVLITFCRCCTYATSTVSTPDVTTKQDMHTSAGRSS